MDTDKSSEGINESELKSNGQGGSSTKAFAGVISLLLVIAGVYAMMKPMNQTLNYMQKDIERLRIEIKDHSYVAGHIGQIQQESSSNARFEEIKTQFINLREVMGIQDKSQTKKIDRLEDRLSASLLEVARLQERLKFNPKN